MPEKLEAKAASGEQVKTPPPKAEPPRGAIAEWAVTILLLLFGTTTLVQAFVIPTASMEDTLLIGDHLLVDKLAYSPPGSLSRYLLPYEEPKHGDIIVFRYPADITQTFVKRTIGVPGDHIKIINRVVYRNGVALKEPYIYHKSDMVDSYRDNFPSEPPPYTYDPARDPLLRDMLENHIANGEAKNGVDRTNGWYKPMVRVFKNARNRLVRDGMLAEDACPSYCVECLIYNAADYCFGGSYQQSFDAILNYLFVLNFDQFVSQNGIIPLFGPSPVQWGTRAATDFLVALRNLWNNWR